MARELEPPRDGWPRPRRRRPTPTRGPASIRGAGRPSTAAGSGSSRSADDGSHRSTPVQVGSTPKQAPTSPGPRARWRSGMAARRSTRHVRRGIVAHAPATTIHGQPGRAHHVDAGERLDGADQHGGRGAGHAGHHVEAVIHPVDKVHVGDARRPAHDRVAAGRAEARVRGQVLRAAVGLDLDDAPDPSPGLVVADEERAEQAAGGLGAVVREERPFEDAQAQRLGKRDWIDSGTRKPKIAKKAGMIVAW